MQSLQILLQSFFISADFLKGMLSLKYCVGNVAGQNVALETY